MNMNYHSESTRTHILQVIRWSFEALGFLSSDSVRLCIPQIAQYQKLKFCFLSYVRTQVLAGTQHMTLGGGNSPVNTILTDNNWPGGH